MMATPIIVPGGSGRGGSLPPFVAVDNPAGAGPLRTVSKTEKSPLIGQGVGELPHAGSGVFGGWPGICAGLDTVSRGQVRLGGRRESSKDFSCVDVSWHVLSLPVAGQTGCRAVVTIHGKQKALRIRQGIRELPFAGTGLFRRRPGIAGS